MTPQDVGGEDLEEMEVMEQLKNDGESEVDGDVVESAFSALRRIKTSCSSRYCFSLFFLCLARYLFLILLAHNAHWHFSSLLLLLFLSFGFLFMFVFVFFCPHKI